MVLKDKNTTCSNAQPAGFSSLGSYVAGRFVEIAVFFAFETTVVNEEASHVA